MKRKWKGGKTRVDTMACYEIKATPFHQRKKRHHPCAKMINYQAFRYLTTGGEEGKENKTAKGFFCLPSGIIW